jgi:Na+/H+-translocating membrane pyrophosphatase
LWASLTWALILGALGLMVAYTYISYVIPREPGAMQEIATALYEGAMVFLKREYQILTVFVLQDHLGGKRSEEPKAAVVGDTVGAPFKDTSGPLMNILIKFMPVVSLVLAPILR